MTLSPLPPTIDASRLRAMLAHLGPSALLAHIRGCLTELEAHGVKTGSDEIIVGLDALAEAVHEHLGRTDSKALHGVLVQLRTEARP